MLSFLFFSVFIFSFQKCFFRKPSQKLKGDSVANLLGSAQVITEEALVANVDITA